MSALRKPKAQLKLTSYNGQNITYDNIGNPLTYRNGMSFTWENGRQLKSMSGIGLNASFSYNADGVRTKKVVNGTEHIYDVSGSQILREKVNGNTLYYLPDENGRYYGIRLVDPAGVVCYYFYVFNLQGDVIGVIDGAGNYVAKYTYDAWGKLLTVTDGSGNDVSANSGHIANLNPIRYRGYYYDVGTGFYYCGSRYYDPVTSRYLNADGQLNPQEGLTGYNMFQYCGNNPVNRADPTGRAFMFLTAAIGAVAGAVVGGVVGYVKTGTVKGALVGAGVGAVAGGAIGLTMGAAAGVMLAGSATASTAAVMAGGSALVATVSAGGLGAGATYVANNISQAVNKAAPAVQAVASKASNTAPKATKVVSQVKNDVINLERVGSALKTDLFHSFPNMVDNYAGFATQTPLNNGATLYQLAGSWTNQMGSYGWKIRVDSTRRSSYPQNVCTRRWIEWNPNHALILFKR